MTTVGANVLTFTATGLSPGSHTVTVTAVNSVGESALSNAQTFVVQSGQSTVTSPGQPTGVNAIAGVDQVTVSWVAPANTGNAALTGFTITSVTGPTGYTPITPVTAGAGATSAIITGLTPGAGYSFAVAARNASYTGSPSNPSPVVTVTAPVVTPVTGVNLLSSAISQVTAGAGGYVVAGSGALPTLTSTTATVKDGTTALLLTSTNGATNYWIQPVSDYVAVTAGQPYTAMVEYHPTSSGVTASSQLNWYDASYARLTTVPYNKGTITSIPAGTWTNLVMNATAPTGAVYATVQATIDSDPNATDTIVLDDWGLFAGNTVTTWSAGTGLVTAPNLLADAVASVTGATSLFTVNGSTGLPTLSISSTAASGSTALQATASLSPSTYWLQPNTDYVAVTAGTSYTAVCSYRSSGANVTGFTQLQWYDANLTSLGFSANPGVAVPITQGAYSQLAISAAAPTGAMYATVQATVISDPNAGGIVLFDQFGLYVGSAVPAWSAGTGTLPTAPSAPTLGTVTASAGQLSVAFTPGATGGLPVTYTATAVSQ